MMTTFLMFILAHENHENEEYKEEQTTETRAVVQNSKREYENEGYLEYIFEHLHNKLVHFPIALTFGAFLLNIFGLRRKEFITASLILLVASFIFSIPTVLTGLEEFEHFLGKEEQSIAETHRLLGIVSSFAILIYALVCWKASKYISLIFGFLVIVLISITGFYGGILSHG